MKLAIRNQAEAEVEPSDIDFLPDRLINPGEYEPPFHTHDTAGPTEGAHGARLIHQCTLMVLLTSLVCDHDFYLKLD